MVACEQSVRPMTSDRVEWPEGQTGNSCPRLSSLEIMEMIAYDCYQTLLFERVEKLDKV